MDEMGDMLRVAIHGEAVSCIPHSEYSRFFTRVEEKVYGQGTVASFTVRTDQEQRERSLCGYFAYLSDGSLGTREVVDAYAQRMMIEPIFRTYFSVYLGIFLVPSVMFYHGRHYTGK
jgi:hypothetical protein